ncbi:hypothetical protein D9M71_617670 [compost metagenome]
MLPSPISITALRARRHWLTMNSRVSGGNRLAQPHNRLVAKARATSQSRPNRISSRPPTISRASIRQNSAGCEGVNTTKGIAPAQDRAGSVSFPHGSTVAESSLQAADDTCSLPAAQVAHSQNAESAELSGTFPFQLGRLGRCESACAAVSVNGRKKYGHRRGPTIALPILGY